MNKELVSLIGLVAYEDVRQFQDGEITFLPAFQDNKPEYICQKHGDKSSSYSENVLFLGNFFVYAQYDFNEKLEKCWLCVVDNGSKSVKTFIYSHTVFDIWCPNGAIEQAKIVNYIPSMHPKTKDKLCVIFKERYGFDFIESEGTDNE